MIAKAKILIVLIIYLLSSPIIYADDHHHHHVGCESVFAHALQSHGTESQHDINFSCGAIATNNPSSVLPAREVNSINGCSNTCISTHCTASGSPSSEMDAGSFQSRSGGDDVLVDSGESITIGQGNTQNFDGIAVRSHGSLTFSSHNGSTIYKMRNLYTQAGATINLVAGDYWLEDSSIASQTIFNIIGSGTVRLFFKEEFVINSEVQFNSNQSNPAKQLLIYGYKNVQIKSNVNLNSIIYSKQHVSVASGSVVTGAIAAQDIVLSSGAQVTYDSAAVSEIDLGNMCEREESEATHFTISTSNTGTICQPHQVSVTAKDGSGVVTDYTGSITLDTGVASGSWTKLQGNGTFEDSNTGDGKATYTFAESDNGVATFALNYAGNVSPIDIEAYETANTSIRDDDTEGTVAFNTFSLVLTEDEIISNDMKPFAANMTAGVEDIVHVSAYGGLGSSCGIITSFRGDKNLKFWFNYVDPVQGTLPLILLPKIQNNIENNLEISEASAETYRVNFINGKAQVGIKYRDVGMLKLHTKKHDDDNVRGSSNNFVVKPAKISLEVPGNPAASDANGPVFKKAGEAFTVIASVQDIDGNVTPNYGNESSPEGLQIYSSTLVAPEGGRNGSSDDGTLGNSSAFTKTAPGVFTASTVSFDEVGIIKITGKIADEDYMGSGNVAGPESGNVGRFVPNDFSVITNIPIFDSGCVSCGFTYIGQKFNYSTQPQLTITARSLGGGTTVNYDGSFYKLAPENITVSYSSNSSQAFLSSALAEMDLNLANQGNGVALLNLGDGGGIVFNKSSGVNANPFNAEISASVTVIDSDNVSSANNPYIFGGITEGTGIAFNGGKQFYQGRVSIKNANGSELVDLTLPFYVEYFNGTDYIPNVLDSVSQLQSGDINITVEPNNLNTVTSVQSQVSGIGAIILSAPNPSIPGYADIELNLSSLLYLQHDWPHDGNSDGLFNDNPRARGTFGAFSGDPNVIYMRELY